MKISKLKIIVLSFLAGFTAIGSFSAASAWFANRASIDTNDGISGSSQGAYFAGGDGTYDAPYIITNKWHVYNLAWLTYIGWFDAADGWGQDKEVKQPYFVLQGENNLIDMEDLVIPPIGTSIHPFKGNFNGNNNVIINFGVSNRLSSSDGDGGIFRKPTTVSSALANIDIVGFFGVVGLLPSNSTASYSSSINSISDFGLEEFTIQTKASSGGNLIGLAAGYVNATVSGVAVGHSVIDIANGTTLLSSAVEGSACPSFLSHYGTIGYCTEDYLQITNVKDVSAESPNVKNGATSQFGGNAFGASIPMEDIYRHILSVKGSRTAQLHKYSYNSYQNAYYDSDGRLIKTEATETETAPTYNATNGNYSFAGPTETDPNGNIIASYNLSNRQNYDYYMYLDGKRTLTVAGANTISYRYNDTPGYYIHDASDHYLGVNGTNLANVTAEDAIAWVYQNNYLRTTIDRTTYYLRSTGVGNLSLTDDDYYSTTWTQSDGMFRNSTYGYIVYDNGWTTRTTYRDTGYRIYDGSYYLTLSGGNVANTTNRDSAVIWTLNNNNYLTTTVGGTTYYLYSTGNDNLSVQTRYYTEWARDDAGRFYSRTGNRYIVFKNGSWTATSDINGTYSRWKISYGTNYLNYGNTGAFSNTTNANNAGLFTAYENGSTHGFSAIIGGTTYYITGARNATSMTTSTNNIISRSSATATSGYLNRLSDTRYYYLNYSNGWTVTRSSWNADETVCQTLSFTEVTVSYDYRSVTSDYVDNDYSSPYSLGSSYQYARTDTLSATYTTNETYFPLKFTDDYSDISYRNTGYIVSGANYMSNSQIKTSSGTTFPGDIRVSEYDIAGNLSVALGSTTLSTYDGSRFEVLTKTAKSASIAKETARSGYVRISDGYNKANTNVSTTISSYGKYDVKTLGLKKYTTARDYFHTAMDESVSKTKVYGLHFMNAEISPNRLVTTERAMVNGWEYMPDGTANHYKIRTNVDGDPVDSSGNITNDPTKYIYDLQPADTHNIGHRYQLPQDCIDFNLADNGTINFFAGTFFSGNSTFFSLHRIFRDSSENITDIKEIRYVYDNGAYHSVTNPDVPRYIFQYTGGGYSETLVDDTTELGELLFDTTWITTGVSPWVSNAAYYFEIPAVPGEYALGSVSGKDGAYLLYLDIGTSDESNDIIVVEESITTITDSYQYPAGIDFVSSLTAIVEGKTAGIHVAQSGGTVGTVIIPGGVNGSNISFTLSDGVLSCGPPSAGSITQSTFIGDDIGMKCGEADLTAVRASRSTMLEEITTKWTYSVEDEQLYKDVTTVTTIDDGPSDTVVAPQEVESGVTQTAYENRKLVIIAGDGTTFVQFYYYEPVGSTVSVSYEYTYSKATGEYTYVFTITCVDSPVVVHIKSVSTACKAAIRGINQAGDGYETTEVTAGGEYTIRAGIAPQS